MPTDKQREAVTAEFNTRRERYVKLKAELYNAMHEETDDDVAEKLLKKYSSLEKKQTKVGLDPLTISVLLALVEAFIRWWLKRLEKRKDATKGMTVVAGRCRIVLD